MSAAFFEHPDGGKSPVTGSVTLGRSTKNEVVVPDEKVSRRHAIINSQEAGQFWLVDLGSSNGTYVNGKRLQRPQELRSGDRVRLGNTELVFHLPGTDVLPALKGTQTENLSDRTILDMRAGRCWLLLADIAASSVLARTLAAEEMPALVGQWFSDSRDIVEAAGGSINKYLGDGFFAYWSAGSGLSHIERLVQNFVTMQGRGRVEFRWVLHFGLVQMGGMPSMGEESLSGPEVNFIFRAEKLAGTLGCLAALTAAAVDKLGWREKCESLGRHPLAGFDGTHELFRLNPQLPPG